ncbi:MAG: ABC transporter permease [Rhodothermales bacterium]
MNIVKLTTAYLNFRKLGTFLNVLLLGLGMATIVVLMLFSEQLEKNLQSNLQGVDLVVGAKGSPLQLILSSVFHIDTPTGNISASEADALKTHPMIAEIIPLALGDSYEQYRIVGSSPALLKHYETSFDRGRIWQTDLEVVVGAEVAKQSNISIGETIISAHGISGGGAHGDHPLKVVGILEPAGTVVDRLIITDIKTVWAVHGMHGDDHENAGALAHEDGQEEDEHHHDEAHHKATHRDDLATVARDAGKGLEYTSLIVKYKTPIAAATLPRYINNETNMQAAAPVYQTARLLNLLGTGIDAFRAFAIVLIVVASLGVFIALYNAMKERAYDLAMMRTMGASRQFLVWQVMLEGIMLSLLGALVGLLLGHLSAEILGRLLDDSQGIGLSGFMFSINELWLVLMAVGTGTVASVLPAIVAYRTDIAQTLAT